MIDKAIQLLYPYAPWKDQCNALYQLIYKWKHSRGIIAKVLSEKYADLSASGWKATEREIRRDVDLLMGGNFWNFLRNPLPP